MTVRLIPHDLHSGVKDALADNAPPGHLQGFSRFQLRGRPQERTSPSRDKARIVCRNNNVVCIPKSLCISGSTLQKAKKNASIAMEMSKPKKLQSSIWS